MKFKNTLITKIKFFLSVNSNFVKYSLWDEASSKTLLVHPTRALKEVTQNTRT